jgi:hypothetical protein
VNADQPPAALPTLTEVVNVPSPTPASAPATSSEDELRKQILVAIQRQVDEVLEVRLREAMAPALTRLTDALVREARRELALNLRDLVARVVADELSRQRDR